MQQSLAPILLLFALAIGTIGCATDVALHSAASSLPPILPSHFAEVVYPEDNVFSLERWELGKELFYSKSLSVDFSVSCASCHKAAFGFGDNQVVSPGVENRPGLRNVPGLANIGYHPYFTREGGVPTLEMQVFVPIQEHNEFDFNIALLADRLNENPEIVAMSNSAYARNPDPFVITRALATFQRSLLSFNSKYDEHLSGTNSLTEAELQGLALFQSERLGCSSCHGGFNFSDYSITNNGLYENYLDDGRFRLTELEEDRATFKVPSLRNLEFTAPYMHDGSLSTIEEVVEHYAQGPKAHLNLDPRIRSFDLSEAEKNQLVLFLLTLSDYDFISNELFQD